MKTNYRFFQINKDGTIVASTLVLKIMEGKAHWFKGSDSR